MDFKHHIMTAWDLTLNHIVAVILLTLVMIAISTLTLGILAPVMMAGYTQSLLQMMRGGREPKVQDLFTHMNLFLPLLGFGIAVFLATTIGFMLLLLPGIIVLAAVTFCCIYMIPLMTDNGLSMVEAVKESYAMARRGALVDHVVVVILFVAINIVGGTVFIGVLFTQPLATLFLLSTYEEKTRTAAPPKPPGSAAGR